MDLINTHRDHPSSQQKTNFLHNSFLSKKPEQNNRTSNLFGKLFANQIRVKAEIIDVLHTATQVITRLNVLKWAAFMNITRYCVIKKRKTSPFLSSSPRVFLLWRRQEKRFSSPCERFQEFVASHNSYNAV